MWSGSCLRYLSEICQTIRTYDHDHNVHNVNWQEKSDTSTVRDSHGVLSVTEYIVGFGHPGLEWSWRKGSGKSNAQSDSGGKDWVKYFLKYKIFLQSFREHLKTVTKTSPILSDWPSRLFHCFLFRSGQTGEVCDSGKEADGNINAFTSKHPRMRSV